MKLYEREKQVLFAFATNDFSLKKTGQALYMTPQNVRYHIDKVRARTGLNARNFFDLGKLLEAAGYIGRVEHG